MSTPQCSIGCPHQANHQFAHRNMSMEDVILLLGPLASASHRLHATTATATLCPSPATATLCPSPAAPDLARHHPMPYAICPPPVPSARRPHHMHDPCAACTPPASSACRSHRLHAAPAPSALSRRSTLPLPCARSHERARAHFRRPAPPPLSITLCTLMSMHGLVPNAPRCCRLPPPRPSSRERVHTRSQRPALRRRARTLAGACAVSLSTPTAASPGNAPAPPPSNAPERLYVDPADMAKAFGKVACVTDKVLRYFSSD
ncbi:hypothetical protein GGX14DRAFT_557429 [Mycena pura]|uniref:Uncharacterized protein n=1 Tax=Mycena pura TaxID=153505 RepID=A0AAD6YNP9_9AGAR|nr:hypothetical protein GGX14DRAFT_557429 [Mycena pura]